MPDNGSNQHFTTHSASRTPETHWLLIVNANSSHHTSEFDQYYTENHVISVCISARTSHLLQPQEVSNFLVFKREYSQQIRGMIDRISEQVLAMENSQ
jgi:hypothetical protein